MDYLSYYAYSVDLALADDCLAFKWSLRLWVEFSKEYREELEVNPHIFQKSRKYFKWKSRK